MRILPCLLVLVPLAACLPDLKEDSSLPTEGDTDTDTDTDAVLLDQDDTLPGPEGHADYVDYSFHVAVDQVGSWVHIELTSKEATDMVGIMTAPWKACSLEVPEWGWALEDHRNQGWVRPISAGVHTLSVFGIAPEGGTMVHASVRIVDPDELPWKDPDEPCTLGGDMCTCTERCNCRELSD